MRIMLNMNLPSEREMELLEALGFDVSRIENQYHGRHYYVEAKDDSAFQRKDNLVGIGRMETTISYYGVEVIKLKKFTLLTKNSHSFELDEDAVLRALSAPAWAVPVEEEVPTLQM